MEISQYRLSKDIGVRTRHINGIAYGKWAVSPVTGPRLARYFGMSDTFWSNLQSYSDSHRNWGLVRLCLIHCGYRRSLASQPREVIIGTFEGEDPAAICHERLIKAITGRGRLQPSTLGRDYRRQLPGRVGDPDRR